MKLFLGREPIMDIKSRTVGYDILFRHGSEQALNDFETTKSDVADTLETVYDQGIRQLTVGRQAFIDLSPQMLRKQSWRHFPKKDTVMEVQATHKPEPDIVEACQQLKSEGFMLALDNYRYSPAWDPLLEAVDHVKVDLSTTPRSEMVSYQERLRTTHAQLIARGVETPKDLETCKEAGYEYFQGYYFSKPDSRGSAVLSPSKAVKLQLIEKFSQPDIDFAEAEEIIKHDPDLTMRLLRYVNSAALGVRFEIRSIRQAMAVIGLANLRMWSSLLIMSDLSEDQPSELLRQVITRGRFCELLAEPAQVKKQASDLFLVGMFSLLDAVTGKPMKELLKDIPLTSEINEALMGESGFFQNILSLAKAFESGDWQTLQTVCTEHQIAEEQLIKINNDAVNWAENFTA